MLAPICKALFTSSNKATFAFKHVPTNAIEVMPVFDKIIHDTCIDYILTRLVICWDFFELVDTG